MRGNQVFSMGQMLAPPWSMVSYRPNEKEETKRLLEIARRRGVAISPFMGPQYVVPSRLGGSLFHTGLGD